MRLYHGIYIDLLSILVKGTFKERTHYDSPVAVDEDLIDEIINLLEYLKKNQSAPRPSEHPPVMGGKMSKRLNGIKGCKYKTSSWHLNRFPDADNIGSTV